MAKSRRYDQKLDMYFIITDITHIFRDVSVINRFNTGIDNILVRCSLNINFMFDRNRLASSKYASNYAGIWSHSDHQSDLETDSLPWKPQMTITRSLIKWWTFLGRKAWNFAKCGVRAGSQTFGRESGAYGWTTWKPNCHFVRLTGTRQKD